MKKNIRLTLKSVSLLPLMLLSLMAFEAQAETASFKTTISRILITEGKYGNCMVRLDTTPQSQLPDCSFNWVSFSCDGSYTSQDVAYRMLEMSQMAYVLEKEVFIQIDDSRKHNGYCLAYRVDLMQ